MNKKNNGIVKILIIIFIFLGVFIGFFNQNISNYIKLKEIDSKIVEHPEILPTKQFARATSFGFDNIRANILWLETIQYIGGNAISAVYKKYLFVMIDLITELNPYFAKPYKIGMLLLPDYNPAYEDISNEENLNYIRQAESIGLKGINNFCDLEKVNSIINEGDLEKIWNLEKYIDPCYSYEIPYFLAYIYYFHLKDPEIASNYYKVASANTDSIDGAKILSAIMKGKGGNREKSILMFLNIGKTLDTSEDKICTQYSFVLEQAWVQIFRKGSLSSELIQDINESRDEVFGKFDSKTEHNTKQDSECSNYISKAVREFNLHYVEVANEFYKNNNDGISAENAKVLYDNKYIDYLPIDYQQYKDYGTIYEYNKDTGKFDYSLGTY